MGEVAKYLYCIIRCGDRRVFEEVSPIGGSGSVYTVAQGGLAMVVSDTMEREVEGTRANMVAHQRVLERVLERFTILPVRFGTVTDGDSSPSHRIQKLLEGRSGEFSQLLADMDGKIELGLKALWRDEGALYAELAAQDGAIRRLRDSVSGKNPQATHFERIRLGEMVKGALDRRRSVESETILAPLRPMAHQVVENLVTMDRMILNAAFLVDKGREDDFDGAINRLDEELGRRIVFRYVGPVPPYNFVNVVVNWQES